MKPEIVYDYSITADEVNILRASIGFRRIHPEQLKAGLDGSALIITARDKGLAVSMARLIWDGGAVALLTDVIVMPAYRLYGIETELVKHVFAFLREKLKPGFGIQLDVRTWGNQKTLFEELGFQTSTVERRGIPMHICLTEQIELTDAVYEQCSYENSKTENGKDHVE